MKTDIEILEKSIPGPWKWTGQKFRDKDRKIVSFSSLYPSKDDLERAKANVSLVENAYETLALLNNIRQDFENASPRESEWMGKRLSEIDKLLDKINNDSI